MPSFLEANQIRISSVILRRTPFTSISVNKLEPKIVDQRANGDLLNFQE